MTTVPYLTADEIREAARNLNALDVAYLERQRDFSLRTFGPGKRTAGVTKHIEKELDEIRDAPDDLEEWADVIILALDGALRTGAEPAAILSTVKAKQARNERRTWPDWRTFGEDHPIEHERHAFKPGGTGCCAICDDLPGEGEHA